MHNIKDLRKNLKNFKNKLLDRNFEFKIDLFEKLDNNNRKLINEKEKLEQEKKLLSKSEIAFGIFFGLSFCEVLTKCFFDNFFATVFFVFFIVFGLELLKDLETDFFLISFFL